MYTKKKQIIFKFYTTKNNSLALSYPIHALHEDLPGSWDQHDGQIYVYYVSSIVLWILSKHAQYL